MLSCRHPKCDYPAQARPVLVVEPLTHGSRYTGEPSRARLPFVVCLMHRLITTAQDIVTDETWNQIVEIHRMAGRADPDRATLRLEWEAVKQSGLVGPDGRLMLN